MTIQDCEAVLARLRDGRPKKFFLDTDAANEIDDQFVVAYSLLLEEAEVIGFGAAPFVNQNADTPAEGMERSYAEILRVRELTLPGCGVPAYRGADRYLPGRDAPVDSEAARAIIDACRSTDDLVFVASIGCFTDTASALLLDPGIGRNLVAVLIGANDADRTNDANEFNLAQDRAAAQVILESGVRVILLPAEGGTEVLSLSVLECASALEGRGIPVGDYLTRIMRRWHHVPEGSIRSATHIIWDIAAAALLRRGTDLWHPEIRDRLSVDGNGFFRPAEGKMIYCKDYDRDGIFSDLFRILNEKAKRTTN